MLKHLLFIALLLGGGYYFWTTRPVTHGPGVVAPNEPEQKQVWRKSNIEFKDYKIEPVAEFNIEARVLSKQRYDDDARAEIAPYDFVLGWGPMSDETNLDKMMVRQERRTFDLELTNPPIPLPEIYRHIANVHLAPSTVEIRDKLGSVRQGHVVRIKGYLVNITTERGRFFKSSLSRSDRGNDAGEILWIEEFIIL